MPEMQPNLDRFVGYDILRKLAQGMFTDVYEARHSAWRELHVALKILRRGQTPNRFLLAAQINARLNHPRIPKLHMVVQSAGQYGTAKTFIDGDSLNNGIGRISWSPNELANVIAEIANALDYAHGLGVVHGYVHPRHILLGRDRSAWLIGFGEYWPKIPKIMGNPLHVAPEQLESGEAATPASDIYGLSETAIWLLCGRHPFQELPITELFEAKRKGKLCREIRQSRPDISPAVEEVLRRGLATKPADRYASAGEFAAAFADAERVGQ